MGGDRSHEGRSDVSRIGNVLFGADKAVAAWVAERIAGFTPSDDARALGVIKGDALVAGVVYERWNGVHVEASIAAEPNTSWADRRTLHAIFYYPFVTLGCHAISVTVPSTNLRSLNLATKLGFEPEAMIKFAATDGSTLVVLKQYRDQCRWIDHGQRGKRAGAARRAGDGGSRGTV